jgi:nucleoside 2-deoxyribosyltransferase
MPRNIQFSHGTPEAGSRERDSSDRRRLGGFTFGLLLRRRISVPRHAHRIECSRPAGVAEVIEMKIYLAGPLFTTAERDFNLDLTRRLRRAGHEVWLPQEHEQRSKTAKEIFEKDVEGIDWAEAVVANMDGPDPDSGTCWECGYAYRKKPVIVFRTDFRAGDEPGKAPYNLMLTESATRRLDLAFAGMDDVARCIEQTLRDLPSRKA